MGKAEDGSLELGPAWAGLEARGAWGSIARKPQAKFVARQSRDQTRWVEGRRSEGNARGCSVPWGAPLAVNHALNLRGLAQQKAEAFGRQPIPISGARIIGLGIRQAEFGLVKKQGRGLHGLEATGLERQAAVVRALTVTARLSWKNAGLLAATG